MTWKDSMEIGIPEVDRQHKALCGMLDDFYNASVQGKGAEEVMRLLGVYKSRGARPCFQYQPISRFPAF